MKTQPFRQPVISPLSGGDRSVFVLVGKGQYFELMWGSAGCGVAWWLGCHSAFSLCGVPVHAFPVLIFSGFSGLLLHHKNMPLSGLVTK